MNLCHHYLFQTRLIVAIIASLALSCVQTDKGPVGPPVTDLPPVPPISSLSLQASDIWVYRESLESPWFNASWSASVTMNSTEQAYSGTNSIKVALTSAWGALSLHYGSWFSNPGIDPSLYRSFDFAIYSLSSGTRIAIFAENDQGEPFPKVEYGAVAQNQWTVVSIPMSQLSPNGQMIHRIDIQDLSGTTVTFYADQMRFSSVPSDTSSPPPPAPMLISPPDGATQVSTSPTLSWSAANGATSYHLQVSANSGFSAIVTDQAGITGTSHTLNGLSNSTTYYWHVNASNSAGTSAWSATGRFTTTAPTASAPDLTIDGERLRRSIEIRSRYFGPGDCAVVEACATAGNRKILRFDVIVPNFGTADLRVGSPADPANRELFQFSPCHGHYHYEGFAEYRLLNTSNGRVAAGHKQAFCLMDSRQYWSGSPSRNYDCDYQGISVGWADVYSRTIDCQWVDITGVPAGNYILEVEINVGGRIYEGNNEWPNIARVAVRIP